MYAFAYSYVMNPLSFRIKEIRKAKDWTQAQLAEKAGVRRATVNRIENAKVTSIDLEVLEKLAKALEVDPGYLIVKKGK